MRVRNYTPTVHNPYSQGKSREVRALVEEGPDIAIPWKGPGNRESVLIH